MVKYTKGVCVIVICTSFLFDKCIDCLLHTVWKNKKFTLIFCEKNFFVTSLVKTLLSRNFRENSIRVNLCNFYTVLLLTNYMPRSNGYIGLHLFSMYLIQYVIYKKILFRKKKHCHKTWKENGVYVHEMLKYHLANTQGWWYFGLVWAWHWFTRIGRWFFSKILMFLPFTSSWYSYSHVHWTSKAT